MIYYLDSVEKDWANSENSIKYIHFAHLSMLLLVLVVTSSILHFAIICSPLSKFFPFWKLNFTSQIVIKQFGNEPNDFRTCFLIKLTDFYSNYFTFEKIIIIVGIVYLDYAQRESPSKKYKRAHAFPSSFSIWIIALCPPASLQMSLHPLQQSWRVVTVQQNLTLL